MFHPRQPLSLISLGAAAVLACLVAEAACAKVLGLVAVCEASVPTLRHLPRLASIQSIRDTRLSLDGGGSWRMIGPARRLAAATPR